MVRSKIVVGTSNNKSKAQDQYNLMTSNNINAHIKVYKIDSGELYCVEAGPYSMRKEILEDIDKIKGLGIINAFITSA